MDIATSHLEGIMGSKKGFSSDGLKMLVKQLLIQAAVNQSKLDISLACLHCP